MKLRLVNFCFIMNLLVFNYYANAGNFSTQTGIPTIQNSSELKNYVNFISDYKPETPELTARLQKTVDYYQRVHILKTIQKLRYTVDCIPFAEQPALIDDPLRAESLLAQAKATTTQNFDALQKIGSHFDLNPATECPLGSVAILRPSKAILTSKSTNKKGLLNHLSSRQENYVTDTLTSTAGYTWEQGITPTQNIIYIPTRNGEAYFKGPQLQTVTPMSRYDHSLDQFWLTNTTYFNTTYSVEFGIIASAYFTTNVSTSIFIFASTDNYGANSCYNMWCPNFVQSPGTPAFGVPIIDKNADYIFQVNHVDATRSKHAGYYLTLVTSDPSANTPRVTTLLGYYPDSLYPAYALPDAFSVGAEVFASTPGNGTTMYGNYVNPYADYEGAKQIGIVTQNGNHFPFSTSIEPAPYGLIWRFGQQ